MRDLVPSKGSRPDRLFFKALKNTPFGEVDYVLLQKDKGDRLFFSVNAYHNDLQEFRSKRKFFYFTPGDFPPAFAQVIYQDDAFVVFKLN